MTEAASVYKWSNWMLLCALIVGLLLPSVCFVAYVSHVQFVPGFEPMGGIPSYRSVSEAFGLGFYCLSHISIYVALGFTARDYVRKRPNSFIQMKSIVIGGGFGLIVASTFFLFAIAGYIFGTEPDRAVDVIIIANGLFGILPGWIAFAFGGAIGHLVCKTFHNSKEQLPKAIRLTLLGVGICFLISLINVVFLLLFNAA